ncbi:MAG: putative LPS assembly protein LptD [Candidatus Marinimicrobia bacterium]|nr:putative LPS assembly protein LptD [Candidatus Neomarinimicrobiota bacterium]
MRYLFYLLLLYPLYASSEERLKLIHADELENITDEDGNAVQYLRGNVKFEKGEATITALRAYYRNREGIGSFVYNVRMEEDQKVLTADSVVIDSKQDIATAFGNTHFTDEEYRLLSDTLIFFMEADSGIASGDVEFTQRKQVITAQKLTYTKHLETGTASYTAQGTVVIREENRQATCGKSMYDAEKEVSILLQDPVVVQEERHRIAGKQIELTYQDDLLQYLVIPEKAHILYRTEGKVPQKVELEETVVSRYTEEEFFDDMTGSRLEAYLKEGNLDSMRLEGMATTLHHLFEDSIYQGQNTASGDTVTLLFAPDTADRQDLEVIHIVGGARGEYVPDESADDVDAPIIYRADTIRYSIPDQRTHLYHGAQIDYKDTRLNSGFVNVTWKDNLLRALPAPHGNQTFTANDMPTFKETGREPMIGESLIYNLSSGRGRVKHGRTKMEDGYYRGEEIQNQTKDTFFVSKSIYTTCDLDSNPHFHFESRQMKMIMDDKVIAKPIILYLGGIPLFGLPFGVFPDQGGKRHSGWIMPSYGENSRQGQYLKGLGYFWAVNEFMNSQFSLDFYDRQGIVFHNTNRYFRRYAFSGGFNFRYNRTVATPEIAHIFNKPGAVRWSASWNHSQRMRKNQSFNVSAQYYNDSQFNRRLGINRDTRLNQKAISNATYSKRWPEHNISISTNLSETRNLMAKAKTHPTTAQDSLYFQLPTTAGARVVETTTAFPTFKFRKGQSQLFGGTRKGGTTFHWSYNSALKNRGTGFYESEAMIDTLDDATIDTSFVWGTRQTDFNNSWVHNVSLSGSGRLFKVLSLRPSFALKEEWITKYHDAEAADTLGNPIHKQAVQGFRARHTGTFSVNTNTKLYGLFPIRIGPLKALRHTITPSVGFSFRPDYSKPIFGYDPGYFKTLTDENGKEYSFDYFHGSQIGATSKQEQRSLNISVKNLFQAKVRSGDEERKIDNLLTWNMRTSYNFAADEFRLSKLRSSIRAGWLRKLNLDFSMAHDFYDVDYHDGNATRVDRIRTSEHGIPLPRLTEMNAATGFKLSGKRIGFAGRETQADTAAVDTLTQEADLTSGGVSRLDRTAVRGQSGRNLWNLRVSLRYSARRNDPLNPKNNLWMNTSLGIQLTEAWRIQYSARFDLLERDLVSHDFQVYRDLHCWELNFNWTPSGFGRGFYMRINVKSPTLRDLKLESRGGRWLGPSIP